MLRHEPPSKVVKFPEYAVSEWTGSGSVHIRFLLIIFFSAQVLTQLMLRSLITAFHLITQIQGFQMDLLVLPWRSNRSHD